MTQCRNDRNPQLCCPMTTLRGSVVTGAEKGLGFDV